MVKNLGDGFKGPCIIKLASNHNTMKKLPKHLSSSEGMLLHSIVNYTSVLCKSINSCDETRFSIPELYEGFFEFLSENGESSPPLHLVSEVAKLELEKFLIRSKVDALVDVTDKTSVRSLQKGSVLNVKGRVKITKRDYSELYLHCEDKDGFDLYLNYNTKGVFSSFAKPKGISGVHTMKSVLTQFRLPCTVRIVSGKIPRAACSEERLGVFRLLEVRKERIALLCPLSAKQLILPVALNNKLSFYKAGNMGELRHHYIFNQLVDSCTSKVEQYMKTMKTFISSNTTPSRLTSGHKEENNLFEEIDEIYPYIRQGGAPPKRALSYANGISHALGITTLDGRSYSQPALNLRTRSGSLATSTVLKQHTVLSQKTETTFEFQCTSNSLTLGKDGVLQEFIKHYTSKESLQSPSSYEHSGEEASDEEKIYFNLDKGNVCHASSIKDILPVHNEGMTNRS